MSQTKNCPKCGFPLTRSTHGQSVVDVCKNCSYQINLKTGKVIQGHDQDFDEGQMLNCPKCNAELCAPKNRGVLQLDCPFCLHKWVYDTNVSDEENIVTCPKCGRRNRFPDDYENCTITCADCSTVLYTPNIVICSKCGTKNRLPADYENYTITCADCSTVLYSPNESVDTNAQENIPNDESDDMIVVCPQCGTKNRLPDDYENYTITCADCSTVLYTPQEDEEQEELGFFGSIANYFKERKESAEAEEIYIEESPLTHYIGDLLLQKMHSLRPRLRGGTKYDYFSLEVYKTSCCLYFHEYDLNERKYKSSELIERYNFPMIQNIFKWDDGFTEIKYLKARKWFRQVVYNEHMAKCGFIKMDDFNRICIFRSLV